MEPFIGGDIGAFHAIIEDLRARQWIRTLDDGCLAVSDGGRSAHATIMMRVAETRNLLRRGITDAEYLSVVTLLARMASNLEGAETEP